jgi:2-polyprenyl-3-methyl-5-hydroxy-6-metoxy-1,4-benzoquinol methylase
MAKGATDLMERAAASCILCGGPERDLLIRQREWTVYRCGACGLGFLDPRPDASELGDLYRDGYFDDQYGHGLAFGSPEMQKRLSQESHRIRFFRRVKKSGKVLDIGCGMGYFLLACRDAGYDVEGMDISADSAAYVRREMEIPVAVGAIDGIDYPPESFDIITMWHFLEHTSDPRPYLQKAGQWLKRDGVLVVDVPNYAGTDARKTWARWKGWQLPCHLYHYTPETLKRLLANHGFGTVRSKSYLSEHVKEKLERTLVLKPFARLIARCYSGHSFAVVAQKAENREQESP